MKEVKKIDWTSAACKVIDKGISKEVAKEITGGQGKKAIPLASLISCGNMKLPKSMAIFNMGTAGDCPSEKLGLCQAIMNGKVVCYALKAERLYPGVEPYRKRQEKLWKSLSAMEFAIQFLAMNALRKNPLTVLRMNESGDFWSQECVDKAEKVADILGQFGIPVYVYTVRKDLDYSQVKHLVINGSGFTKLGVTNEFKFVETEADTPKGYVVCPGDCRYCNRCQKQNRNTVIVKH